MSRYPQDFADTLAAPTCSESFAEDLIAYERRQPEPEAHWLNPYALPLALLLVGFTAWWAV
jgi:hypothetical protein